MTPRTLLAAALTISLLAACAPAPSTVTRPPIQPPLTAAQHYHPHEPGTTLTYLDTEGNQYHLTTLAPRLLSGTAHQHQQYEGPNTNWSAYRLDTPQGLLLARQDTQERITTYDPPILELPPAGRLHTGLTWGGETTARHYHANSDTQPHTTTNIAYLTTVTDARLVRIGRERVTAYLISTEQYERQGEIITRTTHERWYAPHYGDIQNREGHQLAQATNQ